MRLTPRKTIYRERTFQSTHPRGVRQLLHGIVEGNDSFNPRTHEGCDRIITKINIRQTSFNPRTHEGCDLSEVPCPEGQGSFNPRTHEGCDFVLLLLLVQVICFNPRTHEGCDYLKSLAQKDKEVSIHAPTRGATKIFPNLTFT